MEPESQETHSQTKYKEKKEKNEEDKSSRISQEDFRFLYLSGRQIPEAMIQQFRAKIPLKKETILSSIVGNILKKQDDLIQTAKIAHYVLNMILYYGLGDNLVKVYLETLDKHKKICCAHYNKQQIAKSAPYLPLSSVPYFYSAFQFQLNDQQYAKKLGAILMKQQQYKETLKLAEITKNQELFKVILDRKFIKKKSVYSAMRSVGLHKENCPEISQSMTIAAMKHWSRQGDKYLEQIYESYPRQLALELKRRIMNLQISALAICSRNIRIIDFLPNKWKQDLQSEIKKHSQEYEPNPLQTNIFSPSDPAKYLCLSDFGLTKKNIIEIYKDLENVQQLLEELFAAKTIGLDTQSRLDRIPLDSDEDVLEIVQISTQKNIYIIDMITFSRNKFIIEWFTNFVKSPQNKIIGHTINHDVKLVLKKISIDRQNGIKIKCEIIDLVTMHGSNISLANLCQIWFQKPICKQYTITNWSRRPLLQNQVHYAALDAFIVLQIYHKMVQKNKV